MFLKRHCYRKNRDWSKVTVKWSATKRDEARSRPRGRSLRGAAENNDNDDDGDDVSSRKVRKVQNVANIICSLRLHFVITGLDEDLCGVLLFRITSHFLRLLLGD